MDQDSGVDAVETIDFTEVRSEELYFIIVTSHELALAITIFVSFLKIVTS